MPLYIDMFVCKHLYVFVFIYGILDISSEKALCYVLRICFLFSAVFQSFIMLYTYDMFKYCGFSLTVHHIWGRQDN